ncbi:hypothetical protein LW14_26220 [Rhizobium sp. H41]|nr:hypothetical protein LW14_26220 [Rhizobium sp. H41]
MAPSNSIDPRIFVTKLLDSRMRHVPTDATFKIFVTGHVDDLFALSLFFPEGAIPDFFVVTAIEGEKDRMFDRVTNAENKQTFVSGPGCAPLFDFFG